MSTKLFTKCETFDEFFKTLRADLERLRGKKFRLWKLVSYWVNPEYELIFQLITSYTPVVSSVGGHTYGVSWYSIAEASHELEGAVHRPLRSRKKGYDVFTSSGGHSHMGGDSGDGYLVFARMDLKHAPKLKQLVRLARDLHTERNNVAAKDPIIQSFEAQIDRLKEKINLRHDELLEAFDHKNAAKLAKIKSLPRACF
jgi:hypothetical protein